MKLGDIVTKEQFLKLAPLGLQITSNDSDHSNVILGYCIKTTRHSRSTKNKETHYLVE